MKRRLALIAGLLTAGFALAACGTSSGAVSTAASVAGGSCPTAPVPVVVSVDQWGDIVSQLGGACAQVTTILTSSAIDPHDYAPGPTDLARFGQARLVVINGAGYDDWARKALATVSPQPQVVNAAQVVGVTTGHNPHLWYSPTYVTEVAAAVTARLQALDPKAAAYFAGRAAAWTASMQPYLAEIRAIRAAAQGKTYAATEPVFDDMAAALGLVDRTPTGYRNAAMNGSEPAPGDVLAFQQLLKTHQVDVLVYNTQTAGSVPQAIRDAAQAASIPVVDVTESVPRGATSFEAWQTAQLSSLAKALGVHS